MENFFQTVILLGALQGVIMFSLLFFVKNNRRSNRLLACLIGVITLASFNLYGNYINWFGSSVIGFIVQFIPLVLPMAVGPLLYLYTRSVLAPEFKFTKLHRVHFYALFIDIVPQLTVIIFVVLLFTGQVYNKPGPWGSFIDAYNVYADIPRWISISFYLWLSAKYGSAYQSGQSAVANGKAANFRWLQQIIQVFWVFQAIWLVYLIPYVIPQYTNWVLDTFNWYPVYIPLAIIIYWLGIRGYMMQAGMKKMAPGSSNSLPAETIEQTSHALTRAMETDRLFLNPELSVSILSQQVGIPAKTISAVLNQHLQTSFSEFVNGYRIAAFKERICQPGTEHLTIAGVAAECGFNSQATFQRIFKEKTGMSPSAYLQSTAKAV